MKRAAFLSLAFLASPLPAALWFGIAFPLTPYSSLETALGTVSTDVWSILQLAFLFYIVCAPLALITGLPAYLVLRNFGLIRWWSSALVGASIGLLWSTLLGMQQLWCSGAGFFGGLLFWLIVRADHGAQPEVQADGHASASLRPGRGLT